MFIPTAYLSSTRSLFILSILRFGISKEVCTYLTKPLLFRHKIVHLKIRTSNSTDRQKFMFWLCSKLKFSTSWLVFQFRTVIEWDCNGEWILFWSITGRVKVVLKESEGWSKRWKKRMKNKGDVDSE